MERWTVWKPLSGKPVSYVLAPLFYHGSLCRGGGGGAPPPPSTQ